MTAMLIDGKVHARELKAKISAACAKLKAEHGLVPGLATILVGDDPASHVYVRNKIKTAEALGLKSVHVPLPATASEDQVVSEVLRLNADASVHGILVQMPLPNGIRAEAILDVLDPAKDVDALTPHNAGLLLSGRAYLKSCTPMGVMILLQKTLGDISGKRALVIGRSLLFGKPAAQLLLAANATVTMAHSRTVDLPALAREADILVAAIGSPEFVKADWIKPGATVIDVGINRVPDGDGYRLTGDVAFEEAKEVAGYITPVPGGVGAMTITCLMRNTLIAAVVQAGLPVPEI